MLSYIISDGMDIDVVDKTWPFWIPSAAAK